MVNSILKKITLKAHFRMRACEKTLSVIHLTKSAYLPMIVCKMIHISTTVHKIFGTKLYA